MKPDQAKLELLINQFRRLSDISTECQIPCFDSIKYAEDVLHIQFPSTYLEFLRRTPGIALSNLYILRIYTRGKIDGQYDIIDYNIFNNSGGLPKTLVAFYGLGNGDFDCFNTEIRTTGDEYQIVNWRHDAEPDEPPDPMNDSFPDWLAERIRDRS